MSEKRGRGQPKFEPTQDQRGQVKMMKALGIPEDRICKTMDGRRDRLRAASDFRRKARTSWRETQLFLTPPPGAIFTRGSSCD
jgi:hypothetical protein